MLATDEVLWNWCDRCGTLCPEVRDKLCAECRAYLDSFYRKPKHDPRQGTLF